MNFVTTIIRSKKMKRIFECRELYLLLLPAILYYVLFHYVPIYGVVIAFKSLTITGGILHSPWADPPFQFFDQLFTDPAFWNALRNTVIIALYKLIFFFPIPIAIAILLNELRTRWFSRIVQTVIYLPHFISWTIMAGIVMNILSMNGGVINNIITAFGGQPINFIVDSGFFRTILVITTIFKDAGWSSIIYFAAITSINPELYEACMVDGGNRWRQMLHITLPGILPVVTILLILTIGNILVGDTQQVLTLYSPNVYSTGDILGTYIYRVGIQMGRFSFAAAAGLFNSIVSLVIIIIANQAAKKLGDTRLF